MVLAGFQIQDKLGRTGFFQENFLVADTSVRSWECLNGPLVRSRSTLHKGDLPGGIIPQPRLCPPLRGSRSLIKGIRRGGMDEEAFVVHVASLTSKMSIHPAREA